MRDAVPPKLRLAAALRLLSIGKSYPILQFPFQYNESTISQFIPVAGEAICNRYKPVYFKVSFFIFNIKYTNLCFVK